MWVSHDWEEYELIDAGDGKRLERWGERVFIRPDPTAIWPKTTSQGWESPDAIYHRSDRGGGKWQFPTDFPHEWEMQYSDCIFKIRPMGFKHMGIFPEQATNWDWASSLIRKTKNSGKIPKVLNLFAYTGGATVAAAKAGAEVCHVDASKGMVQMASQNAALSGLSDHPIRYIVDDCAKFVSREIRRNRQYDAIILDPPSYGRGPAGEIWRIEDELCNLLTLCSKLLTADPLFVLLNSYTTGLSAAVVENIQKITLGGHPEASEIGLPISSNGLIMPCGVSGRWTV